MNYEFFQILLCNYGYPLDSSSPWSFDLSCNCRVSFSLSFVFVFIYCLLFIHDCLLWFFFYLSLLNIYEFSLTSFPSFLPSSPWNRFILISITNYICIVVGEYNILHIFPALLPHFHSFWYLRFFKCFKKQREEVEKWRGERG